MKEDKNENKYKGEKAIKISGMAGKRKGKVRNIVEVTRNEDKIETTIGTEKENIKINHTNQICHISNTATTSTYFFTCRKV